MSVFQRHPAALPSHHVAAVDEAVRFLGGEGASVEEIEAVVTKIRAASKSVRAAPVMVSLHRWGIDVWLRPAPGPGRG